MLIGKRTLTQSEEYWDKAKNLIPAETQCSSKGETKLVGPDEFAARVNY